MEVKRINFLHMMLHKKVMKEIEGLFWGLFGGDLVCMYVAYYTLIMLLLIRIIFSL